MWAVPLIVHIAQSSHMAIGLPLLVLAQKQQRAPPKPEVISPGCLQDASRDPQKEYDQSKSCRAAADGRAGAS